MKEIKEETKREVIDTHIYYEATDGTKFANSEECKRYEASALGVLRTKASKMLVSNEHDAWTLLGGYDDHIIMAYKPQSKEDADTLMQLMLLENPWLKDDSRKALCDKRYSIISDACKNNDLVLFGVNCDNEYYFINSRQNIIDNLMSLDKKEVDNAE